MNTDDEEAARSRREEASRLQKKRKALVLAAEEIIQKQFSQGKRLNKPKKTQFSNLIGLCNEAQCGEEIANYLRYQAGRGEWEREFTKEVIDGIKPILAELPEAVHVSAWKLYATYLTRAYVFHDAAAGGGRGYERSSR